MMKNEKNLKKKSKSVKSLRFMDDFFPDFSLLESCQPYIIAKCKASSCCKLEAVIQRFRKKGVLKHLAKITGKPLCQSLFLNKVSS